MTSPDWTRPLVYFSITAIDPETQRHFYSELFNWTIPQDGFMSIPAGIGGPANGISGHIAKGTSPSFTLYFQVRDIHESIAKAIALGGKLVSDPFQIPNAAMIATISDPEGNSITLVQQ